MTGVPKSGNTPPWEPITGAELAARLRARRRERGISLREAAAEVGVSAATLSRVESGDYLPERDNLFRLLAWLGLSGAAPSPEPHAPGAGTMEAIELHLRADKELSEADAETIAQLVRLAYERLRTGAA
jgi:transcriptional regulator with XRE-family HTH domain